MDPRAVVQGGNLRKGNELMRSDGSWEPLGRQFELRSVIYIKSARVSGN